MEINTKWNYSRKSPFSYVTVHSTDEPRIRAQYLKYSEGNTVDDKPGFYSVDISTRGGTITLYLDHEHVEGLVEKLQQGMVDYTSVDTPVAVCQAG
jgi:hypothetical protein